MKVAIFDFDGTLYPNETFPLMMNHLKMHPAYHKNYKKFIARILPMYIAYKMKLYPEQKMKENSMRAYISAFKHLSKVEVELFFSEIGNEMRPNLSLSVLDRLVRHQEDGYYVMLVSGAFLPLLQAVTRTLSFDCIIGTTVPFKDEKFDHLTPVIHINGARKKDEIFSVLANKDIDWEGSFAYGDSFSDLDVLELVGNPIAVKPEARLLQCAQERHWEII